MIIIITIINVLMPVKLNSFTHLRALLVLLDRGILAHATSVPGHCYGYDYYAWYYRTWSSVMRRTFLTCGAISLASAMYLLRSNRAPTWHNHSHTFASGCPPGTTTATRLPHSEGKWHTIGRSVSYGNGTHLVTREMAHIWSQGKWHTYGH